MRSKTGKVYLT